MTFDIIDLTDPLPEYLLVINQDGWGGTWCKTHVFQVVGQEVPGNLLPIALDKLKAMGIAIEPSRLRRHHGRVVTIKESTEQICRICDFDKLEIQSVDNDPTPVACLNPCCAGH